MSSFALQQTTDTINARYAAERAFIGSAGHAAQLARAEADTADYRRERRLKAVRRYLRERAARAA